MKIKLVLFHLCYFAAACVVYITGVHILKAPDYNYSVLLLGTFLIVGRQQYVEKNGVIMLILNCIVTAVLYFPLKSTGIAISAVSLMVYVSIFLLTWPFAARMKEMDKTQKDLTGRAEALSRLKGVGMKKLQEQDDEMDREIREITSIYSAVKELSATMTLDSAMTAVSEILKKVIKTNFKISLDDIGFIIVFKREYDYYVAHSFGFDEDGIKKAEKQVVASILRNVSKNEEVVYLPKIEDSARIGVGAFLKSVVYMPFYAEKKLLGVIMISGLKEDLFNEKHIDSLKLLSNQIAITMEKVHLYEEVQAMSINDGLTGLTVHRHFQEKLELELKRTERYGGRLSVVMADIDFFKKINDTYGHLAGDFILKTIALIFKNHTVASDIVARYGGEEFVIVFPDTEKDIAHMKAVKIRKDIESYNFVFNGQQIKVTMSMGVAGYPEDGTMRRSLIEKADKALYKAKEEGRNRVIKAV